MSVLDPVGVLPGKQGATEQGRRMDADDRARPLKHDLARIWGWY